MISISNLQKVKESLLALKNKFKKDLEFTVSDWVYNIVNEIVLITPLGDDSKKTPVRLTGKNYTGFDFQSLYDKRPFGWIKEPGLTRGNWQVSLGRDATTFDSNQNSTGRALGEVSSVMDSYELGQSVFIGNATPYLMNEGINAAPNARGGGALNKGYSAQAPNGVQEPALELIKRAYRVDFKVTYERFKT